MNKKGVVILGPTGVGKTSLSIKLAKVLKTEIISADSTQLYTGLDIGTAKISNSEKHGIIHHMIDIIEPIKKQSVGQYQKNVDLILKKFEKNNIIPLIVGGTGLYINSITDGLSKLPNSDPEIRGALEKESASDLYEKLLAVDPECARNIHPNNKRRVERALEVFYITGKQFSIMSKKNSKNNNFDFIKIGLERNRESLYQRIDLRVDLMIKSGFVDEVRTLYSVYGDSLTRLNIIGYSEIINYLCKNLSLEEAIYQIKQNSRRYAKRQFTWFKNDPAVFWYNLDTVSEDEVLSQILNYLDLDENS